MKRRSNDSSSSDDNNEDEQKSPTASPENPPLKIINKSSARSAPAEYNYLTTVDEADEFEEIRVQQGMTFAYETLGGKRTKYVCSKAPKDKGGCKFKMLVQCSADGEAFHIYTADVHNHALASSAPSLGGGHVQIKEEIVKMAAKMKDHQKKTATKMEHKNADSNGVEKKNGKKAKMAPKSSMNGAEHKKTKTSPASLGGEKMTSRSAMAVKMKRKRRSHKEMEEQEQEEGHQQQTSTKQLASLMNANKVNKWRMLRLIGGQPNMADIERDFHVARATATAITNGETTNNNGNGKRILLYCKFAARGGDRTPPDQSADPPPASCSSALSSTAPPPPPACPFRMLLIKNGDHMAHAGGEWKLFARFHHQHSSPNQQHEQQQQQQEE